MEFNIEQSKDNYKLLRINIDGKNQYLGSKYNQKREVDNFIKGLEPITENNNFIIFGLSFGEHIGELIKRIDNKSKILIIEINERYLEYCKKNENIQRILKNPRVKLARNKEEVKGFFRNYMTSMNVENLKVEYYCRYDKIYGSYLSDIYGVIKSEFNSLIADRNTALSFGESWFDSILKNLKYIAKGTPINSLKDMYKNTPAIIVSAGPSLEKNIDLLKGVDNALIFSGGRTLKPLLERDIMPSLVGVIDPGEVSYKLVEGYIDKVTCPLVFYEGTNPRIVSEHKGEKIFSANNEMISEIWGEIIQSLSGGGSIAHCLTILAAYMGCSPIIFIGQDFAYTGEKGHANIAENTWSKLNFNDYTRNDDFYVKDIYGEDVRTSIILNNYRLALEEIIEVFPSSDYINATEGGAFIKGTKVSTLKEIIGRLKNEKIVSLEEYTDKADRTNDVVKYLDNSLKNLIEMRKLCEKGRKILADLQGDFKLGLQIKLDKNLNELDRIDKKLREGISNFRILDSLLYKSMYDIENSEAFVCNNLDTKEERMKKNLNRNYAIYTEIKKLVDDCYEKVSDTKVELGNIE